MNRRRLLAGLLVFAVVAPLAAQAQADRATAAARRVQPQLEADLATAGLRFGAPLLIRIFMSEAQLEVWVDDGTRHRLFRTYPICSYSGALGPKVRMGDRQAPEGFYSVGRGQLNPASSYHLSFDLGYPNAYDRAHRRTGDFLMVHGHCVSIGCYAMGDAQIEEIYTLVDAALRGGQARVEVHAFPFRFDRSAQTWDGHPWAAFWKELAPAYAAFEQTRRPPTIRVVDGHYLIEPR
jgi:murein L,D-transpeptidase YafK